MINSIIQFHGSKVYSNEGFLSLIRKFIALTLMALLGIGVLQPQQAQAWCGPNSINDACNDTLLLLQSEAENLEAQLQAAEAADDQAAINSLLTQLNTFYFTIISLQQYILAYDGPCKLADEDVCPTCGLALSQCAGHQEEQCPTCGLALSQCAGHQEEQCPTCGLALSQCAGHQEEQCPTCGLALSQCAGHQEEQCPTCGLGISQCSGHME